MPRSTLEIELPPAERHPRTELCGCWWKGGASFWCAVVLGAMVVSLGVALAVDFFGFSRYPRHEYLVISAPKCSSRNGMRPRCEYAHKAMVSLARRRKDFFIAFDFPGSSLTDVRDKDATDIGATYWWGSYVGKIRGALTILFKEPVKATLICVEGGPYTTYEHEHAQQILDGAISDASELGMAPRNQPPVEFLSYSAFMQRFDPKKQPQNDSECCNAQGLEI